MIVVFGAKGMLGKAVVDALQRDGSEDFVGLSRQECDITDWSSIVAARLKYDRTSLIINCAGDPNGGGQVNSLGPWYLARAFNYKYCRIMHVSTDCVFASDDNRTHRITTIPYFYGGNDYQLSKMLGEQFAPNFINIRTSFIGYEHGLLKWLLDQPTGSVIEGWDNAFWSGSSVYEVARRIVQMRNSVNLTNVEHLATDKPGTKFEALMLLVKGFDLDITVDPTLKPVLHRGLAYSQYMSGLDDSFVMKELVNARPN